MKRWTPWVLLCGGITPLASFAQTPAPAVQTPPKIIYTFGSLKTVSSAVAREKVIATLKQMNRYDEARVTAIWADENRSVLDRTTASLLVANPEIAQQLAIAQMSEGTIPTEAPAVLKDPKVPGFFR
ncbi:MAG: hypothetical protein ACRCZF_27185, partial [Gemmataceae bacterium]